MNNTNNLIITADDFGLCESVNEAIVASYLNNNITNTSIMINMGDCQHNAHLLLKYSMNYGMHFSINRGTPFNKKSTLCDSDGNFFDRRTLFKKILNRKINKTDVEYEFKKQLELCKQNNLKISHIDSDNHVHFNPFIFNAIFPIIKEKKLSFRNLNPCFFNFKKGKRLVRQLIFLVLHNYIKKKFKIDHIMIKNKYFLSLYDIYDDFQYDEANYFKLLQNSLEKKTIELMVHPYFKSKELNTIYPYEKTEKFLNNCFVEGNILTTKKNIFKNTQFELTSFNHL